MDDVLSRWMKGDEPILGSVSRPSLQAKLSVPHLSCSATHSGLLRSSVI